MQFASERNKDIDGGYAWIILLAAFLICITMGAIDATMTLTYKQLIVKFGMTATEAGWVNGIHGTVRMLTSPAVSYMCYKTSFRFTAMLGALCYTVGLLMLTFATKHWILYVGFGVISGFGANTAFMMCYVALCTYFVKRRGRAVGIYLSGNKIGAMVFSPIIAYMYDNYGYTSTAMLLTCLALQRFALSALFRPLETQKPGISQDDTDGQCDEDMQNESESQLKSCSKNILAYTGLSLLSNPVMFCLCLTFGSMIGLVYGTTYTSGLAYETSSLSNAQVAGMISLGSILSLPVNILTGFVIDLKSLRPYIAYIFTGTCLAIGITYSCLALTSNMITFCITWILYSACVSSAYSQQLIVMGDILSTEQISAGLGIAGFFKALEPLDMLPLLGSPKINLVSILMASF